MRKGNHRLPAWLAGITVLVATSGVAGAQEPNATGDTGAAAITGLKDCTSASGGTSGPCDETQSGQTARDALDTTQAAQSPRDEDAARQMAQRQDDERDAARTAREEDAQAQMAQRARDEGATQAAQDERDATSKGFDETDARDIAQESASSDESQARSAQPSGRSPDETPQTRVVPPAFATPAPSSMSAATASAAAAAQGSDETGSIGASASDANAASSESGNAARNVARAQESISSDEHANVHDVAADDHDESGRADAIASEHESQSTRSVPPQHATRMPQTGRAPSSSEIAAGDRASSGSDEYRHDADAPSRSDASASQREVRDSQAESEARGAASSAGSNAIQSQFDALDLDNDGTIDAAEAAVSTTLRAQFFTLDADGDGKISISEFKRASDIASIRADRGQHRE